MGGGVSRQFRPGNLQKRPQDAVPLPGDPPKAPKSRAPDEIEQHRLGVVVSVMGGKNGVKALPPGRLLQKTIA